MKTILYVLLTIAIILIGTSIIFAQPPPPPPAPSQSPVDGGLLFLVAAGIGYGIKMLRSKK